MGHRRRLSAPAAAPPAVVVRASRRRGTRGRTPARDPDPRRRRRTLPRTTEGRRLRSCRFAPPWDSRGGKAHRPEGATAWGWDNARRGRGRDDDFAVARLGFVRSEQEQLQIRGIAVLELRGQRGTLV